MNGFQWNKIPDPNPLIQKGKYKEHTTPSWQLKPVHAEIQHMPYNFKVKFESPETLSEGTLIYQSIQADNLLEMQQYIRYALKQGPLPDYINEESNLKTVKFDSYMESGNLNKVFEVYKNEFNLFLTADTNTKGQTRWFHFSVSGIKKGETVRFNICNFHKPVQLFRKGLRPVFLSLEEKNGLGSDWKPVQGEIEFYRNSDLSDTVRKVFWYTLSFSHTFSHQNDTVYFAFAAPYPFTRLLNFINNLPEEIPDPSKITLKIEDLCKSVGGLSVPKLIITASKGNGQELSKRKAVFITGRVHPSETTGSWVMEGILKFLVSPEASELLSLYIFYVIPMLNPDGVIVGNSRCGLMGVDLNRRWDNPSHVAHPTIHACKELIRSVGRKREVLMFCDLHSHSKKLNSFIYGCNTAANGGFTSWTKVRLLPRVIARRSTLFSYPDCRFMVKPDKQGTGRVVAWKEFSITNSFTLETSFLGYKIGEIFVINNQKEFTREDFNLIGKEVIKSVVEYNMLLKSIAFELKINGGWLKPIRLKQLTGVLAQDKVEKWYEESKKKHKNFIVRSKIKKNEDKRSDWRDFFTEDELKAAYKRISLGEDEVEDSSGSDSDPSFDNLEEVNIQEIREVYKNVREVRDIKEIKEYRTKPLIKTDEQILKFNESVSRSEIKTSYYAKRPFETKKKVRKSEQSFYPHTSRRNLNALESTIRPQTSSKLISYKEGRSGRTTPGLSPMIFKTFRKNFGFYQQLLSTKSQMAHGSLEIMCTKLLTKKPKNIK